MGCQCYEEPNQEFEMSEYSTILCADMATGHIYVGGSVERLYHIDYNGQSIHKVGVTNNGI